MSRNFSSSLVKISVLLWHNLRTFPLRLSSVGYGLIAW